MIEPDVPADPAPGSSGDVGPDARRGSGAGVAPWLVIAVGNPSRGDDALGPEFVERMARIEADADDIEFLSDFQLQVEHALDLQGRRAVLFVDAARPGVLAPRALPGDNGATSASAPSASRPVAPSGKYALDGAAIAPIAAAAGVSPGSHALVAGAVLHVARQFGVDVPPAWQLAIEGEAFELGEGLSRPAEAHLRDALTLARRWLDERRDGAVGRHLERRTRGSRSCMR